MQKGREDKARREGGRKGGRREGRERVHTVAYNQFLHDKLIFSSFTSSSSSSTSASSSFLHILSLPLILYLSKPTHTHTHTHTKPHFSKELIFKPPTATYHTPNPRKTQPPNSTHLPPPPPTCLHPSLSEYWHE